jgi:hypothetical protein
MRRLPSPAPRRRLFPGGMPCGAACALALCGCAALPYSYSGSALKPGQATLDDVVAAMGQPAEQWTGPDHSTQLSYPRGPAGYHSFMVELDPAGRLDRIYNVMDETHFQRISRGMSQADVLRTLGPSVPAWTSYFEARRELVWEWHYCNEFGQAAHFDVLLDGDGHGVRSTMSWVEYCGIAPCLCGR